MDTGYAVFTGRETEEKLAAEARHGGRQITEYLQGFVGDEWRGRATVEQIAKAEAYDEDVWSFQLAPSGEGGSADRLARLARNYAAQGSNAAFGVKPRFVTLEAAEAMFAWPIYRAAFAPCTVCGFVGPLDDHGAYGYEVEAHSYDPEPVYMAHLINEG